VRSLVRFVLLVALVLPLLVASSPSYAQSSPAEAESHFKRGVGFYQEADFKAALVEFKRAYELSKNWRLLYNVAQAQYQAHDYAEALASFEKFLADGGDKVPRQRHAEVEKEISRLRARTGRLTVRANAPDATVTIDDEVVGPPPVTRNVAVGARRVTVKKDGYQAWSRSVEVASGDDRLVEAVLEPVVATGNQAPAPSPPEPTPSRRFPWEAWTVTGVLTAGAVTTGILAFDAASKLDTAKNRLDVTDTELHDASKRVKTFGLVTDLLAVGAIGSGVLSLYLTLKAPADAEKATALRVSPWPGGLSASGRF
jgi:tetratricopeptide (TPR) repeat protein